MIGAVAVLQRPLGIGSSRSLAPGQEGISRGGKATQKRRRAPDDFTENVFFTGRITQSGMGHDQITGTPGAWVFVAGSVLQANSEKGQLEAQRLGFGFIFQLQMSGDVPPLGFVVGMGGQVLGKTPGIARGGGLPNSGIPGIPGFSGQSRAAQKCQQPKNS